ncbi:MAG: hypothetical protein RIS76_3924 [Verrucomicrobiota bacterium]|jgi:hypothetical protein
MKLRRALLWLLPAFLAVGATVWLWPVPERFFRGKPERQWIAELKLEYDPEQQSLWKSFGDDGIRMLVRAYWTSYGSSKYVWHRTYRRLSRILPDAVLRLFPSPAGIVSWGPRCTLMSHLGSLEDPNGLGLHVATLALDDLDPGARAGALIYFTHGTLHNVPLTRMDSRTKTRLLPRFLAALQDRDWIVRNNAVCALRFFPEAASVVVPALSQALLDPNPEVQLAAASILPEVATDRVTKRAAVSVIIAILASPNDQIAWQAAEALGELGVEPEIAVPALMATLGSTNALVAETAVGALERFSSWPAGSRQTLEGLLQNPDPTVRERATNLLAAPVAGK